MPILTPNETRNLPISIALVGMPFTGKTESIATLHTYYKRHNLPSKIHIIDYDKKCDSLLRRARLDKWEDDLFIHRLFTPRGDLMSEKEIPNRSRVHAEMMIQELNSFNQFLTPDGTKWQPGQEIGAMVHDSYTEIIDNLWDGILANRGKEVGGSVAGALNRPDRRRGDEGEDIEFTEWRLLREKVIEYIKVAKSFPCDQVFTFHEEVILEEIRGQTPGADRKVPVVSTGRRLRIPIGGTRKLSASIGKYFSIMLYTYIDDTKQGPERYRWLTRPTREIPAAGTVLRADLKDEVVQDFANVLD